MPFFPAVVLIVLVGLLTATTTAMTLNWFLRQEPFWSWPAPPDGSHQSPAIEVVKVALTVTAGLGGAVALTVAYRRQSWTEKDIAGKRKAYTSAAAQLGDRSPTVRLAGVYALANLADEWPERRQQCVDVLCAHLRLAWNPAGDRVPVRDKKVEHTHNDDPDRKTIYTYAYDLGESEVRGTILSVIAEHLHPESHLPRGVESWSNLTLNLTGAMLPEWDLSGCTFQGRLRASGLQSTGGSLLNLTWANLTGADLRGANLAKAYLSLANLRGADLRGANLAKAYLSLANLNGANLRGANLTDADLTGTNLTGANLSETNGVPQNDNLAARSRSRRPRHRQPLLTRCVSVGPLRSR